MRSRWHRSVTKAVIDAQGRLSTFDCGLLTASYTYNGFGEVASYEADVSGPPMPSLSALFPFRAIGVKSAMCHPPLRLHNLRIVRGSLL